ncbi:MAG: DUF6020 family protein [Eubacteriales bacterium]|nr:DUF6020 family protein [Eubacteriales bacterium]
MQKLRTLSNSRLAAGALIALATIWRLPDVATLPANALALWALRIVLFVALTSLLTFAFATPDRRLSRISYPLGFVLACFTVVGKPMKEQRALPLATVDNILAMVFTIAVYTIVFGAVALWLYRGVLRYIRRAQNQPPKTKESMVSRLTGNGFFAFALVLACWIPVWLAFYPGTFRYDADTQFYMYIDGYMSTQHPLLHTLLLGWLLDLGNELDSLTLGVALYNGLQMLLMAGIVGYACAWLYRRHAPLGLRIAVLALFALLPLYPLWAFSATKDVLFGGFVLLLCLQMADLWRDGTAWFRSPVRILLFFVTAVLMMLLRNNGVYALCFAFPFAVAIAKNRRVRTAALLLVCVGGYLASNLLLIRAVDAESGSYVEMLSIPLQQTMRAATRGTITPEEKAKLEELFWQYESGWDALYTPMCADNVKWNLDEDVFSADLGGYLSLWWQVGLRNPQLYLEAFLEQNLPYYYPGAKMSYNIVLGLLPMDMYELEQHSQLPALKPIYEAYDKTLRISALPGSALLADNAVMVWLTLWLLGFAIYRRQRGMTIAAVFLLSIWGTCLLGPIAAMRYMLGFFYTVPVLIAFAFARQDEGVNVKEP